MTKYSGLMLIADRKRELEKRAVFDNYARWSNEHPWASLGAGLLPGVGTATYGMDAARAFSQGRILSGLGNTLGAVGSLAFPILGGGLIRGAGRLLGLGGKAMGGINAATHATTASLLGASGRAASASPSMAGLGSRLINAGSEAERLGTTFGGGKAVAAGMGLSLGGGLLEGGDPAMMQPRERPTRNLFDDARENPNPAWM